MSDFDTVGYERRDLPAAAIVWFAIGLVVALVLTLGAMRIFERAASDTKQERISVSAPRADFPGPHLQRDPATELAALRAAEEAQLHSYRWVDRQAGVIQIPIERAMELMAQRGLPVREDAKGGAR